MYCIFVGVGFINQTKIDDVENPLYSDSGIGGSLGRTSLGGESLSQFKNPLYDYAREVDRAAAGYSGAGGDNTPGINRYILL